LSKASDVYRSYDNTVSIAFFEIVNMPISRKKSLVTKKLNAKEKILKNEAILHFYLALQI